MEGIIYKYTSPSNKSYIGQTIQGNLRSKQHKKNAFDTEYLGYYLPFYCAIRKYGFDSFNFEILNTIFEEDLEIVHKKLDDLEIYYIGKYDSYNNGYNASIGGTGLTGSTHPSSKRVAQYDLLGNFITDFDSGAIAARSLNISESSGILKSCNFRQKSSNGFQWRFIGDDQNFINPIEQIKDRNKPSITYLGGNNKNSKIVYQYTLNYEFIQEWQSIADIKRTIGYDDGAISKVCNGKLPYYGKRGCNKYIWSYHKFDNNLESKTTIKNENS